ncbi:hypothetical protein VULLAG_LOCUS5015 [Vulpes lagopus]
MSPSLAHVPGTEACAPRRSPAASCSARAAGQPGPCSAGDRARRRLAGSPGAATHRRAGAGGLGRGPPPRRFPMRPASVRGPAAARSLPGRGGPGRRGSPDAEGRRPRALAEARQGGPGAPSRAALVVAFPSQPHGAGPASRAAAEAALKKKSPVKKRGAGNAAAPDSDPRPQAREARISGVPAPPQLRGHASSCQLGP